MEPFPNSDYTSNFSFSSSFSSLTSVLDIINPKPAPVGFIFLFYESYTYPNSLNKLFKFSSQIPIPLSITDTFIYYDYPPISVNDSKITLMYPFIVNFIAFDIRFMKTYVNLFISVQNESCGIYYTVSNSIFIPF